MTVYIIYITVHTHTHTHTHNTHLREHMHIHTHTQKNTPMLAPLSPCSPFKYALQLLNCQFKKNINSSRNITQTTKCCQKLAALELLLGNDNKQSDQIFRVQHKVLLLHKVHQVTGQQTSTEKQTGIQMQLEV